MPEQKMESAPAPKEKKNLLKRKRFIIPVILFLLLAGLVAVYWYLFLRGYIGTDDAYVDGDQITVSSKILGRISLLMADEGDTVKQGQLLVQLDDMDLKAQEAQASASLEFTRQNIPVARINLDRARDDFERAEIQIKNQIITQEQFDHARKAVELAQAQNDVAVSQANASKAQLEVIQTQLKNTQIFSSTSGVVARKWVMPGDICQAGQPIFTIYDLQNVWVTANFEETKIASIRLGSSVELTVDAYPGQVFKGKVALFGAATASQFSLIPPNNASGNFTKVTQRIPVKIAVELPSAGSLQRQTALLPGMSVVVRIHIDER